MASPKDSVPSNSAGWFSLGGPETFGHEAVRGERGEKTLSLVVDAVGMPAVAWIGLTGKEAGAEPGQAVFVRQWNGSSWKELGRPVGGSASGHKDQSPDLRLNAKGRPVVAWSGYSGGREIFLRCWNGQDWEELGGSGSGAGITKARTYLPNNPTVAVGESDDYIIAYDLLHGSQSEVYVRQYRQEGKGESWPYVGMRAGTFEGLSGSGVHSFRFPSLAWDGKHPAVIAVVDQGPAHRVRVYRYAQEKFHKAWKEMPSPSDQTPHGLVSSCSLILDQQGNPWVAWDEKEGDSPGKKNVVSQLYLRHWNGNHWTELIAADSDFGVSSGMKDARWPSLGLDSQGQPLVAFALNDPGRGGVYVRHWAGDKWKGLSAADGTGLISVGKAVPPQLATGGNLVCVAWNQEGAIHLNCHALP